MRMPPSVALVAILSGCAGAMLAGCDSRRASPPEERVRIVYAEPALPPAPPPPLPDERSDCAPGAPPSSLANAIDVLRVHCDRGRAIAILGSVGAMALGARFGGGRIAGMRAGGAAAGEIGAAEIAAARTVVAVAELAGTEQDVSSGLPDQEAAVEPAHQSPDQDKPSDGKIPGEQWLEGEGARR